MQLSKVTCDILKRYQSINNSILLEEGNLIRSLSPTQTIFAVTKINEEFPSDAAIYDLGKFLNALKLFNLEETDITFKKDCIVMKQDERKVVYKTCDPDFIIVPQEGTEPKIEDVVCITKITSADLDKLLEAMRAFKYETIAINGVDGKITIETFNAAQESDVFSITLGQTDETFRAILGADNIKMLADDYTIKVGKEMIQLTSGISNYWITLHDGSTF